MYSRCNVDTVDVSKNSRAIMRAVIAEHGQNVRKFVTENLNSEV